MKKMMILFLFCSIICFLTCSTKKVEAINLDFLTSDVLISSQIEEFNDGSYIIYEIYEEKINMQIYNLTSYSSNNSYTKIGKRNVTKYNANNNILWIYTLSATYSIVEGESVTCIDSEYSTNIYESFWSFSKGSTSYNENIAYGKGTFTYKILGLIPSQNVKIDIYLECDTYGNLS